MDPRSSINPKVGMTELSCISFMTTPSNVSLLDNHSSVGTLLPHTSAKVVDSDLNNLPPGVCGELLVSGYLVFQGYYSNPEKTEEAVMRDYQGRQWLRTGDLVTLSAAGECTVIGRVKDMIKRGKSNCPLGVTRSKCDGNWRFQLTPGGENIFPGDVEKALELHPDIAAAAVIGIPDAYWGETVGAFVQRTQNSKSETEIGRKDVKIWLRNRIAPHKVPEYFFWIGEGQGVPDELPVNATGKIVKKELRAIAGGLVQGKEFVNI
jgi:acyl-CoA synthetase (AMP-forming)/AMP-acid ligase II